MTVAAITAAERALREILAPADIRINGERSWDPKFHDADHYGEILAEGSLALGEAYVDGVWDCEDLEEFFYRILTNDITRKVRLGARATWALISSKVINLQTKQGSKRVAKQHYDLGNDLFTAFLDPYYQYSCGYFRDTDDLAHAQQLKLDLICRKLLLEPGDRLLDIGCGWGGLAKFAAERYGCRVTGITISKEQAPFARAFCKGLPVEILLQDYRDIEGTFDKVVSVGMFEHVGEKNYRTYMEAVDRVLTDDGLFLLHTIGSSSMSARPDPWFEKYIFPNSMTPSVVHIAEAVDDLFVMEDWHNFSAFYTLTLRKWLENFRRNWPTLRSKYGDQFERMWSYYLSAAAATFRARNSQLWQIILSKGGVPGGYSSVR